MIPHVRFAAEKTRKTSPEFVPDRTELWSAVGGVDVETSNFIRASTVLILHRFVAKPAVVVPPTWIKSG